MVFRLQTECIFVVMKKTIYGLITLTALACSEAPVVEDGAVVSQEKNLAIAVTDAQDQKTPPVENTPMKEVLEAEAAVMDMEMSKDPIAEDKDAEIEEVGQPALNAVNNNTEVEVSEQLPVVVEKKPSTAISQTDINFDHSAFNTLLQKYVTKLGAVNYAGFKGNPVFDAYLEKLSTNPPRDTWPKKERMAYWINAYNAYTIKLIVDNMPLKSIKDISSPWKKKFFQIDGQDYDLNTIEHGILRKQFDDPRIHFAINCASASCPKLLNMSYEARKLEIQLEKAAKVFVNDPFRNNIGANEVAISKIFDWFKGDFTKKDRTIIQYLNKYANTVIAESTKVKYKDYSWELNDK